ncbi:GspH/FimT family pseudopilin [Ferrimonas balearica]|uniref:GspH/FimT family pseudopilin n=1 Tax=Ferrimonas balearica TaxID=44012 RepID=UPI001C997889|nr:prepilin-type N-terminal cleavage/methylation domain-containing protein [Ferrimonas balearica]MBY5993430.1 prepilin-type N-terminal cleavage/methylation domain-containing protein [Ferrimonas balearica]
MKRLKDSVSPRRVAGLTLLEMLIAVAVLAILVSVAVPSYQEISQNLRLRAAGFQLFETVHQGRSEAIKRDLEEVTLKFITPSTGDWCIRLTDSPDECTDCSLSGQTNKCDLQGDGIVRGVDGGRFPNVSLSTTFSNNKLTLTNRRNTLSAGNGKFSLGSDKAACLVTSNLGRARLCTPNGKDSIWGLEQCGGTVCN